MAEPWVRWVRDLAEEAATADELYERAVAERLPSEYERAVASHGSWANLLAAALVEAHPKIAADSGDAADRVVDVEKPERVIARVSRDSSLSIVDEEGCLWLLDAPALKASESMDWLFFPVGGAEVASFARIDSIRDLESGRIVVTAQGQAVTQDARMMSEWEPGALSRPLPDRFPDLDPDDQVLIALSRRELRSDSLFVHTTRAGQLKVSAGKDYSRVGANPLLAFVVRDGDRALNAFIAASNDSVLLATSKGRALVTQLSQIRPQGRKATGVRAVALEGDAQVVSSFVWDEDAWLILVTASGMAKRMPATQFKIQGRAGAGLQSVRLGAGDEVVSMVQGPITDDVVFLTDQGRFSRVPFWNIPLADRNHRGYALEGLNPDERITMAVAMPPGEIE